MRGGMAIGNSGGALDMAEEQGGAIAQLMAGLPAWASALLLTLAVIAAAALVGMIVGRLYASIRYPDPEKQSVISPKIKVLFLCILAACGVWLYSALNPKDDEALPVDGGISGPMDDPAPGGPGGIAAPLPAEAVAVRG